MMGLELLHWILIACLAAILGAWVFWCASDAIEPLARRVLIFTLPTSAVIAGASVWLLG